MNFMWHEGARSSGARGAVFVLLYVTSIGALIAGSKVGFSLLVVLAQLVAGRVAVATIRGRERRLPEADASVRDRAWVRMLVSESCGISARRAPAFPGPATAVPRTAEAVATSPTFYGLASRSTGAVVGFFPSAAEAFARARALPGDQDVVLVDFTTGVGRVLTLT